VYIVAEECFSSREGAEKTAPEEPRKENSPRSTQRLHTLRPQIVNYGYLKSRIWTGRQKKERPGEVALMERMVEMTGFELAIPCSRSVRFALYASRLRNIPKTQFYAGFAAKTFI